MKVRLRGEAVPYPLFALRGRLRISGLNDKAISEVVLGSLDCTFDTEKALLNHIRESLKEHQKSIQTNFETLTNYENIRSDVQEVPPIVVVLEGASATGKSLIALQLMSDLTATRFISTDSVRQVLRCIMKKEQYPELFCHTYQAHLYKTAGPPDLDPVIRGFLAQCEIISPPIKAMTERVIAEGAIAVIEGVHIEPGTLQGLSPSVVEVMINPDRNIHRAMFSSKRDIGKLKTVSEDPNVRNREFEATRTIQDYMIQIAKQSNVPIITLTEYDDAFREICSLIISKARELIRAFEDGAAKE